MPKLLVAAVLAVLAATACSKKENQSPVEPRPGQAAPAPRSAAAPAEVAPAAEAPAPELPATLTDVNLAAADMGGGIEELPGNLSEAPDHVNYGAGLTGPRLIDGQTDLAWKTPEDWWPYWMYNQAGWARYPADVVLSFYERKPALVGAVTVVVPDAISVKLQEETSTAPKEVEVWTAMENVPERYTRAGAATLETTPGEHRIEFPAREARFVKLRILSGSSQRVLELAEVRVLESAREGYVPLFTREPGAMHWKGGPREAAQHGLEWLQQSAVDWGTIGKHDCFGCHVHAQALMGQAVALENGYRVSVPGMQAIADFMRTKQTPEGTLGSNHVWTSAVFAGMGFAYAADASGRKTDPELLKTVDYLLKMQEPDGGMPVEYSDPPVVQGAFMMTSNSLVAFKWAAAHSRDAKYRNAADRALAWLTESEPESTQDRVFKIAAVSRYGTTEQKRAVWPLVEELAAQQSTDGGWKEAPAMEASNAFATGQALFALKQAGVSVQSALFRRGVDHLLRTQQRDPESGYGSWKAVNTQSEHAADFAPTMWAVIGLAGAYGTEPLGALQIMKEGDKVAARNLEIVLDVSGSMNAKLGDGNRWQTALAALKDVLSTLPDDLNVGLRVYGHRYSSKSAETCQDTELVVPLAPLDRGKIMTTAEGLKPRGETPLIRSILKAVADLKSAGGGSVMLITDGEESCKGNAKTATKDIKASGVNLTLNIVGFTLTSEAVKKELGALAGSTGGRYYSAQDGAQLARAIKLAALQRLTYEVFDESGKLFASGQTGELSRELPPGKYRIRIDALGQKLEDSLSIVPNETTAISLGVEGDRFVLRR